MKIAYFDCQFGAAGDMLNAALLAAGVDENAWRRELAKLPFDKGEFTAQVSRVMRCGVSALKLDVLDRHGHQFDAPHDHEHDHEHHHHDHEHGHSHSHEHSHSQDHEHEHRSLPDIVQFIQKSTIPEGAKSLAIRIFNRLARAESRVHGVGPEEVHFHEVGAVDAIVDIVGFSIGYDMLKIERAYGSSVAIGSGKVKSQHGLYPVPGPATVYLLEEAHASIAESTINFECLTPTGAAILCEVVSSWGKQPPVSSIDATGYGAGSKDPSGWPNVCRVVIGQASQSTASTPQFDTEIICELQANIDDLNPQTLAFAAEKLLNSGALDVSIIPALMKKGRSGHLLTVLCSPLQRESLEEIILRETSSIGVRWHECRRSVAKREFADVTLGADSKVRVKIATDRQGTVINVQPEYDDCARYADATGIPLKEVINTVLTKYFTSRTAAN